MWQEFVSGWNGASFFLTTSWVNSDSLQLFTDASGSIGFGGIFSSQWFHGQWRAHQQLGQPGISIAWQELFAWLLLAICGALPSLTSASCSFAITSLLLKL